MSERDLTPSELLSHPDYYAFLEGIARQAARPVRARFRVSIEDLVQEGLLWCLQHPDKFVEYWLDGNQRRGEQKILTSMRNACKKYALRDQAAAGGGNRETSFWYRGELIEELLTYVWDEMAWTNPPETEVRFRGDPAHGNNWVVILADVKRAVGKVAGDDEKLLRLYYHDRLTKVEISRSHTNGKSDQWVGRRIRRTVGRIREELGGRPPYGDPPETNWKEQPPLTRKLVSNAQARAITDNSYNER